ncbi:uncharacterized protein V1518DRAFT_429759 [Limtongia smithiae]|uniref:uncharacterized protein n=1 Tax=Limtongia smithiae TaxID=1125753 RepID=UPI0034CD8095
MVVQRVTMFKIPELEGQRELLAMYKNLSGLALKDGKPYILRCVAGHCEEDSRSQGYTVAVANTFADMDGFKFYDTECPAHNEVRKVVRKWSQGTMMVYFNNVIPEN